MVGPKAHRLEAYFFLRVARFLVARFFVARFFVARFLVARFFVARFLLAFFFFTAFFTAFLAARFFTAFLAARFFTAFFTAFFALRRFTAFFTAFLAARFFAGLFFVVRFFAVAISTSSKVGQDCRCTYRIVTSLHVSSGTAHELYITLYYLSQKFCNVEAQLPEIIDKRMYIRPG